VTRRGSSHCLPRCCCRRQRPHAWLWSRRRPAHHPRSLPPSFRHRAARSFPALLTRHAHSIARGPQTFPASYITDSPPLRRPLTRRPLRVECRPTRVIEGLCNSDWS